MSIDSFDWYSFLNKEQWYMYPDNTFHSRISTHKKGVLLSLFHYSFYSKITWILLVSWACCTCIFQRSYKHRGTTLSRNFLVVVFIGKAEPCVDSSYLLPQPNGPICCYGNSSIIWDYSNSIFPKTLILMIQNLRIQPHWEQFLSVSTCPPWYLQSLQ